MQTNCIVSLRRVPGVGKFDTWSGKNGNLFNEPENLSIFTLPQRRIDATEIVVQSRTFGRNSQKLKVDYYVATNEREPVRYSHSRWYDCHYDSYYFTLPNGIRKVEMHNESFVDPNDIVKTCDSMVALVKKGKDQHMMFMHPFGSSPATKKFGMTRIIPYVAIVSGSLAPVYQCGHAVFDLHQDISYNEQPGAISLTQVAFFTESVWMMPNDTKMDQIYNQVWFTAYDRHGNFGHFKPAFTSDNQYIRINNKN